jgi:hypothetical protein
VIINSLEVETPIDERSPLSVPRRSEWYLPSTSAVIIIEKAIIPTDSVYRTMTAVQRSGM